jgi:hypothetical protein
MSDSFDYLVVVQCDIVMERCSGYFCEKAFDERSGVFEASHINELAEKRRRKGVYQS